MYLFNDAASTSDNIASRGKMINKKDYHILERKFETHFKKRGGMREMEWIGEGKAHSHAEN
jgi:hypothetical protein